MRVLSIGECMAELTPHATAGTFKLGFAGDTFNTAWYLARLDPSIAVSYLTAVGDDEISRDMVSFMKDSGIDTSDVRVVNGRTIGLYLISLKNGERSFSYWRGQSAARHLAEDPSALDRALSRSEVIYFSGITLAILPEDSRARLLRRLGAARMAGKIIVFDPNLRPRLWASTDEMVESTMRGAGVADLALPSFEDEALWFGDASPASTAARYAKAGVVTVVVKNGPEPVYFREAGARGEVPVDPLASVIDTTAAGDSFNAGLLAGHAAGLSLREGIAQACRLSRHVVQQRGALAPFDPGMLDRCIATESPS